MSAFWLFNFGVANRLVFDGFFVAVGLLLCFGKFYALLWVTRGFFLELFAFL